MLRPHAYRSLTRARHDLCQIRGIFAEKKVPGPPAHWCTGRGMAHSTTTAWTSSAALPGFAARAIERLKALAVEMSDPYRPELHYMRGPGPKWREKHGQTAQPGQ